MSEHERRRLLNPGPVTLTDRVRRSLLRPDLCHRERGFAALQADVRARLARVYDGVASTYDPVLLTGSGTAAVEAMVGSLVPRDGRALVVANGVYGERVASMLRAQGKELDVVEAAWTAPMDLEETRRRLESGHSYSAVIAVHHETTTGRLNDVPALGALCREHDVPLLLDTVSSFGGEAIDFGAWNVGACAATANKCLHGVPGISFVLARKDLLAGKSSGAAGVYLDLFRHHAEQTGAGFSPFTPAVQVVYALQEALIELEEGGGWETRHRAYRDRSGIIRSGLRELGIDLLLPEERDYSATLTSFLLPRGLDFDTLYEHAEKARFVIYPGQKALMGSIFRIAVMGDLSSSDMREFVGSIAGILKLTDPARG